MFSLITALREPISMWPGGLGCDSGPVGRATGGKVGVTFAAPLE